MSSPIIITSVNTASTVEADGQNVMICDKDRVIEVKGSCRELKINGMRNKIKAAQVQVLVVAGEDNSLETGILGQARIAGSNNQVIWAKAASGDTPGLEEHGPGNRLTHRPAPGQAAVRPQLAAPSKPEDAKPTGAKPTGEKPEDAKPTDAKPTGAKPTGAKPTGEKPEDAKPNPPSPPASKPGPQPPGPVAAKPVAPAPPMAAPKPGGNGISSASPQGNFPPKR